MVLNKLKRALKKPVKKFLKPIMPVVMIGVAFGILMVGVYITSDLLDWVPSVTVPVTGTVLLPTRVVFLVSLLIGVVVGGTYLLYKNNKERIHNYWQQYSTWAKSMIVGSVSAVFGAVGLTVCYLLGWIEFAVIGLGVLITWPLVVGMVLLGYRRSSRAPSAGASIKTAYVLTRGLESRTLSVILGLLVAIAGGLLVNFVGSWYFDRWTFWLSILIAGVFWMLLTLLVYNRYDKTTVERTDLTIIDLMSPESRDVQEIEIKNTAGQTINLTESLIRDTDLDLYRPGFDYKLKPGQCGSFEIDETFSLEPNDDAIELPLGYNLKRGGETPAIFTTDGEIHYLQWTDKAARVIERESPKHVAEIVESPDGLARTQGDSLGDSPVDATPQD